MPIESKLIETWLDIAPQYLNFALRFPRSPKRALEDYSGKGKVESDLTTLLLAGVGASYLLIAILQPASIPEASVRDLFGNAGVWVLRVAREDLRLLPVLGLMIVVGVALVIHGLLRLWAGLQHVRGVQVSTGLSGTVEDSINGALGLGAVFIPYSMVVVCVLLWNLTTNTPWVLVALSAAIAAPLIGYFPASLAATHPSTKVSESVSALSGPLLLCAFIGGVVIYFLE